MRAIVALIVLGLTATAASAQASRPGREKPAIQRAIDLLIEEGEQARKDHRLAHDQADFASRFKDEIPADAVLKALTRRVHRTIFTDAYVRWQLTSFNPPLPALDDRQFLKLMADAPGLMGNPCADDKTVAAFEFAESAAEIKERDLEKMRTTWSELAHQREVIETLNGPALAWRAWIDNQLPPRGPRKVQWLIERVATTVSAGWDARDAKGDLTRMTRDLGKSVGELALTPPQTQMVCEQIQRMKDLQRRMIEDVAFLANGRVDVSFFNLYVSDNDIERWIEALGGTPPP